MVVGSLAEAVLERFPRRVADASPEQARVNRPRLVSRRLECLKRPPLCVVGEQQEVDPVRRRSPEALEGRVRRDLLAPHRTIVVDEQDARRRQEIEAGVDGRERPVVQEDALQRGSPGERLVEEGHDTIRNRLEAGLQLQHGQQGQQSVPTVRVAGPSPHLLETERRVLRDRGRVIEEAGSHPELFRLLGALADHRRGQDVQHVVAEHRGEAGRGWHLAHPLTVRVELSHATRARRVGDAGDTAFRVRPEHLPLEPLLHGARRPVGDHVPKAVVIVGAGSCRQMAANASRKNRQNSPVPAPSSCTASSAGKSVASRHSAKNVTAASSLARPSLLMRERDSALSKRVGAGAIPVQAGELPLEALRQRPEVLHNQRTRCDAAQRFAGVRRRPSLIRCTRWNSSLRGSALRSRLAARHAPNYRSTEEAVQSSGRVCPSSSRMVRKPWLSRVERSRA